MFWTVLDFLQKPLAWFSNFYLRVRSKNSGKNNFFILLFIFFSEFERKTFRLSAKKLQEVVRTTFRVCGWTNFGLGIFFKMFWTVLDFLQKPLAWFSKFYLRVQSKNCGRNGFFLFFFSEFFPILSEIFSDFWSKNFKKLSKLPSACSDEQFLAWNFFQKFWAVLDFLRKIWHGSQTSIFVSREKIPEEIIFLFFFSDFFRSLSEIFFWDFWPKNLKKLSKLTSVCADEQFLAWNFFQNFWTVLDFLQKPLAWRSNFYLRVHSKNSGRNDFFNLLFIFFSDFERIFFRLSAKKLQEVFKTTFYVCRGTVCGLKFFFIFWTVLDFLEKPLAWFSKFYLRVQSKNCGRINFFILLFRIFSEFERKTFRLSAKKLQEVVKTTFRVCGWTNFGLGIFF